MRPPKLIKPYVVTFARSVIGTGEPLLTYVPVRPIQGTPYNECFSVVETHVAQHGGARVIGWAIWERPRAYIEAEFHAAWRSPDGALFDLAARPVAVPRILFLPAPRRVHNGTQVDNVRKSLCKDKDVDRLFALRVEYFRLTNEGDLKFKFGKSEWTPKLEANRRKTAAVADKLRRRYGIWRPEEAVAPTD